MIKHQVKTVSGIFFLLFIISCQNSVQKRSLAPEKQAELISQGKTITQASFQVLSGELMEALEEGGVQHAVAYCHLQANPIIDSLSTAYNATISRISDKYRNPVNKPAEIDVTVINSYRQQLGEGLELKPHLEITSDEVLYYAPIVIQNPGCLLCHGEPGSTMTQENFDFISSKYPDDQATGYKLGDLRGVWKVSFSPEP